jgi:hypothetical protein
MNRQLDYGGALKLLRGGSRLVLTYSSEGTKISVVPGGWVTGTTAAAILMHPSIRSCDDGLLKSCPQTFEFNTQKEGV